MQTPRDTAPPSSLLTFGRYVARRCRRAGYAELANDLVTVSQAVKTLDRAAQDLDEDTQDAYADRDALDDVLDAGARDARANLAGRSADAARATPYTDVFPKGIGYYIAATLDDQVRRYEEFKSRVEEHLPATDPTRKSVVKLVEKHLPPWKAAQDAVEAAEAKADAARAKLRKARSQWTRQVEKTYGALVAEEGKAAAEAYFPRVRSKAIVSEPAAPGGGPAEGPGK